MGVFDFYNFKLDHDHGLFNILFDLVVVIYTGIILNFSNIENTMAMAFVLP